MKWDIRKLASKPFAAATPQNYKGASVVLGTGTNGKVTVVHSDNITTDTITVVVGLGNSVALSAAYAGGVITVTLGTDASGDADATKNTVALIAKAINGIAGAGLSATASGDGTESLSTAVTATAFEDGQLGTPCPEAYIGYESAGTYYICVVADNTIYNTGWRTFSLLDM